LFRAVVQRAGWTSVGVVVLAVTLAASGSARLARLTLNWVDNSGGTARFIVERRTGTTGTYRRIGTTGLGIATYTDSEIVADTTYCYRVKAFTSSEESAYSNEACASSGASRVEERR